VNFVIFEFFDSCAIFLDESDSGGKSKARQGFHQPQPCSPTLLLSTIMAGLTRDEF